MHVWLQIMSEQQPLLSDSPQCGVSKPNKLNYCEYTLLSPIWCLKNENDSFSDPSHCNRHCSIINVRQRRNGDFTFIDLSFEQNITETLIEESLIRLLVTSSAGYLLFAQLTTSLLCHPYLLFLGNVWNHSKTAGKKQRHTSLYFVCFPRLTLCIWGDASYALYLLHWPVVCALKELEVDDTVCEWTN